MDSSHGEQEAQAAVGARVARSRAASDSTPRSLAAVGAADAARDLVTALRIELWAGLSGATLAEQDHATRRVSRGHAALLGIDCARLAWPQSVPRFPGRRARTHAFLVRVRLYSGRVLPVSHAGPRR